MAKTATVDVIVVGGGLAGLTAAVGFAAEGFSVLCVDPSPPVVDEADPTADLRTTAILQPGADLLTTLGLWARLRPHAVPLKTLRIVDAKGTLQCSFAAEEISDHPFGWNFPNWLLRRELFASLNACETARFVPGRRVVGLIARESEALVTLDDGQRFAAALVVAADGRESEVRRALGIGVQTIRYGQTALAFAVEHPIPHGEISTEVYDEGGPFTLVPLPEVDRKPRSAVVWMMPTPEALRLMALDPRELSAAATARSFGLMGPLSLVSRLSAWPIVTRLADRFFAPHVALVAEAAHVVPPIGAQGFNMSLADLGCLFAVSRVQGLGTVSGLSDYGTRRRAEVRARLAAIDLLNRASQAGAAPIRALRAAGLFALHEPPFLRRALMRLGLWGASRPSGPHFAKEGASRA